MSKRPATITLSKGRYDKSYKNGAEYYSVDFWGHNEGQCGGVDTLIEAKAKIKLLVEQHSKKYNIKIINELEA